MTQRTKLIPGETDILIVVDVQYDFLPGGALAVPDGDAVIAPINRLAKAFRHVVLTQDWHPEGHASFASSHPARQPFETTSCPTACRCSGRTIASRGRRGPRSPATWRSRMRSS